MNNNHLLQIFSNYIERFEELNNKTHQEYYKWQVAYKFKSMMDDALSSSSEAFATKLLEAKKTTFNIIDSYTQPFYGLVRFAQEEPETVREMFNNLFSDDNNDIKVKQKKILSFMSKSRELRDKYYPDSYLYKDDFHSVTCYLFLYNPDHNYIYKATHAQAFADCIEFYDDWGTGDNVKLDVYYRMCNQLVEAIKSNKEVLETDKSRFELIEAGEEELHPDIEKHILAFDIIYCCSSYGLFDGISFTRPKSKEKHLMQERKDKAKLFASKLDDARKKNADLEEAVSYLLSVYIVGSKVEHMSYGIGDITAINDKNVVIKFNEGEKQFGLIHSVANGFLSIESEGYAEKIKIYRDLLKKENSIITNLIYAEKEFAPYSEYLD